MWEAIINSLFLSFFAGLATTIGGLIVLVKNPGKKFFGFVTGLAAGVMIILSFLGLIAEAWSEAGFLITTLGFAFGALTMFSLDFFIPHIRFVVIESKMPKPKLFRSGMLIAIGIALHNIPEGLSVGAGYLHSPEFGLFVAVAIALHNIPEGIATAMPLYAGCSSRRAALKITMLSGLVEPIGALLAVFFLKFFELPLAAALAFASGVMIFITLDELVPIAQRHGHEHFTALGIIAGATITMLLMGMLNI